MERITNQKQIEMEEEKAIITIESPIPCTPEQFREWVSFELGFSNEISLDNPLDGYDLQVSDIEFLKEPQKRGL